MFLLLGGYNCPHRTINKIVKDFASFEPTEAKHWVDQEPLFQPWPNTGFTIPKLKLDKMSELLLQLLIYNLSYVRLPSTGPQQTKTLGELLHSQVFKGEYGLGCFLAEDRKEFIEHGIARVSTESGLLVIDEPLIVAAARGWYNQHPTFSLSEWCRTNIEKHTASLNGFEVYLAFYM
jgi:hypothetical protein